MAKLEALSGDQVEAPAQVPGLQGPAPKTGAGESVCPAEILATRCAFLQITEEDCERVRALAPVLRTFAEEFIERFYAHLLAFPATSAFLRDPQVVQRLKALQMRYFESLLRAELDPAYVEERQRVGQVHAVVGLEPQWFLGAFSQYIQQCFAYFVSQQPDAVKAYTAGMQSLLKLIVLDVGLALDAYWAQFTEQLQKALELYTQANAELREFAHLTSHDLRTPLATISALCEEFLDEFGDAVPAEGRQLIEAARTRTLRTKGMVDELLSASEAAAQPHQRARVSVRSILDEVLGRLRPEVGERPITLEVPDVLPEVYAHPGRLREVFYQLLSNAVKFMDKPQGVICVTIEPGREEHVFCIADNGPGIAPADQAKVFAPFHRLRQHRHLPGSGLGLYFARKIVEEQGGRMWVESTPGRGSRFYVAFPNGNAP